MVRIPQRVSNRIVKKIEERILQNRESIGFEYANLADKYIFTRLMSPWVTNVFELNDRYSSYYNIENRYPFYDRRLVEFILAIPEYERTHKYQNKYIVRKAGKYLLPQSVINRTDKAEFSCTLVDAIRDKEQNEVKRFHEISEKGFISNENILLEKFSQFLELDNHTMNVEYLWQLWVTFSINIFLNNIKSNLKFNKE